MGKLRSVHERPTWPPHSNSEKRTVEKKVHERPTWRRHSGGKAVLARAGKINSSHSDIHPCIDLSAIDSDTEYKIQIL